MDKSLLRYISLASWIVALAGLISMVCEWQNNPFPGHGLWRMSSFCAIVVGIAGYVWAKKQHLSPKRH